MNICRSCGQFCMHLKKNPTVSFSFCQIKCCGRSKGITTRTSERRATANMLIASIRGIITSLYIQYPLVVATNTNTITKSISLIQKYYVLLLHHEYHCSLHRIATFTIILLRIQLVLVISTIQYQYYVLLSTMIVEVLCKYVNM